MCVSGEIFSVVTVRNEPSQPPTTDSKSIGATSSLAPRRSGPPIAPCLRCGSPWRPLNGRGAGTAATLHLDSVNSSCSATAADIPRNDALGRYICRSHPARSLPRCAPTVRRLTCHEHSRAHNASHYYEFKIHHSVADRAWSLSNTLSWRATCDSELADVPSDRVARVCAHALEILAFRLSSMSRRAGWMSVHFILSTRRVVCDIGRKGQ